MLFLTRIAGFRIRGAVYMAAVVESYIYLSRGPHNWFFESHDGIAAPVKPTGLFCVALSQKKEYIVDLPRIRAQL